jgi:hypothetical protein
VSIGLSDDELRANARDRIKGGKLMLPGKPEWAVVPSEPLTYIPHPIFCAVCGASMHPGDTPYRLANAPDEPQFHPRCFEAWLAAARAEYNERAASLTFEENFHLGDERTGEAVLIWADAPNHRVRFVIPVVSILMNMLGCKSAFANSMALDCCCEVRPRIEGACRRAYAKKPGSDIELRAEDF